MSGNKVYEDLCYNEIKMEKIKFVFKIREFSKRNGCVESSTFPSSAPENVGKWLLQLETNSAQGSDINIHIKEQTSTVKSAKVILSLINEKGDVVKNYVTEYRPGSTRCLVTLSDRSYVLYKANGLLRDDELTIVCLIEIKLPDVISRHCLVPAKCEPPPCRLAEDLGQLLASRSLSDVTIALVGGAELKAHKAVLAARSPVFAAMFSNPMLEKETGVVEITDMDADVFQAMLEFIYTGSKDVVQTGWAHNLFAAASKYQLERLKVMCEDALCKVVTLDNVLENLTFADLHSAAGLKEHCISLVTEHKAAVLTSPAWETFISSHPTLVTEIMETNSVQK